MGREVAVDPSLNEWQLSESQLNLRNVRDDGRKAAANCEVTSGWLSLPISA